MISRRRIVGGLLLVGILAGYLAVRGNPGIPDEDRILQAIERARYGVVSGNISEIMAVVSHDYNDSYNTYSGLRTLILYGLREHPDLQVVCYPRQIKIKGAMAFLLLDVEVTGEHGTGNSTGYRGVLRVYLAREPSRRYLFFPDHCWRAVRVDNIGEVESSFER